MKKIQINLSCKAMIKKGLVITGVIYKEVPRTLKIRNTQQC